MMLKERFERLCAREGYAVDKDLEESIGIYKEKRLHRILKNTLCEDSSLHEVKVGRYVADILEAGIISEIQTASTAPLLKKLKYYLENTEYSVRVVIPIIVKKKIIRAERETGEILRIKGSPKKERELDALARLSPLRELLGSRRISVLVMGVTAEEYRYSERMRYRREGRYDSELFPEELVSVRELCTPEDYRDLLPIDSLPKEFFASDFSAATGFRGRDVYSALKLLLALGIISGEKRGRATVYQIK